MQYKREKRGAEREDDRGLELARDDRGLEIGLVSVRVRLEEVGLGLRDVPFWKTKAVEDDATKERTEAANARTLVMVLPVFRQD